MAEKWKVCLRSTRLLSASWWMKLLSLNCMSVAPYCFWPKLFLGYYNFADLLSARTEGRVIRGFFFFFLFNIRMGRPSSIHNWVRWNIAGTEIEFLYSISLFLLLYKTRMFNSFFCSYIKCLRYMLLVTQGQDWIIFVLVWEYLFLVFDFQLLLLCKMWCHCDYQAVSTQSLIYVKICKWLSGRSRKKHLSGMTAENKY